MMARMCIICGQESKDGVAVEDTQVIVAIRVLKKKFGIAANNELVVCKSDLEEYQKRRKNFEKKLTLHIAGGALLLLISVVLPLISSRPIELVSVLMVMLLALFLAGLAMLSYVPTISKQVQTPVHKQDEKTKTHKPDVKHSQISAHKTDEKKTHEKKRHAKSHGKKRE